MPVVKWATMRWEIILLEAVVVGSESIRSGIVLPAGNL